MMKFKSEKSGSPSPPKRVNIYQQQTTTTQTKFEGRCEDIKGFIFYCADDRQADRYNLTMREIDECVDRTYTYGGDHRRSIDN
jgi:hypothetical protein